MMHPFQHIFDDSYIHATYPPNYLLVKTILPLQESFISFGSIKLGEFCQWTHHTALKVLYKTPWPIQVLNTLEKLVFFCMIYHASVPILRLT